MNKTLVSVIGALLVVGTFAYNVYGNPPDEFQFQLLSAVLYVIGTYMITRKLFPFL